MKTLLLFLAGLSSIYTLDNGLARTPPMGWNSWERFRCNTDCLNDPENCIGEKLYMQIADRMAEDGYKDVGYEYVNVDDCWMAKKRGPDGRLQADPDRFPSGMKALGDYIHSKGLKFGIYEDFGTETCGGFPGSKFFMESDAQTFADWGVDLLKLDGCYSNVEDMTSGYPIMEFFLNKTGRPILYSCSWPAYFVANDKIPDYKAIAKSCNIWRNFDDIQDSWDSVASIIGYYGKNKGNFSDVAGPGNFNDPDMIIVGNFGLSKEQQKSQMAMWAIMAAPLIMSTDLRNIDPYSKALLQHKGVIAINQDPLGQPGALLVDMNQIQFWFRPVTPQGSVAFAILYTGSGGTPEKLSVECQTVGMIGPGAYNVTEVFDGRFIGMFKPMDKINVTVNPSGVFFAKAVYLG
ncbi:alpha-N-acetylgalactosaminidase-like [Saccostrea cucullata]|uniref:alpha-N-acetylgalactosaminidase-like n=1 Tax=Saccostrea cuccullata TaxID=36930 RepID=UPI002ED23A7B